MAEHDVEQRPADWFAWERPTYDFPFYNDKSIPSWQVALLIASPVLVLAVNWMLTLGRGPKSLLFCLGTLIPVLIISRGNIGTIVKKPQLGDIPLAIAAGVLTIVYALSMAAFIQMVLGIKIQGNAIYEEARDSLFYVWMLIQLFGEELIKINMFLGLMTVIYRHTSNRKTSVLVAAFITLALFGLAHLPAYHWAVLQVLLIQGLGSIFDLFLYLRTKNVLVSYAMHVMQDFLFLG